MKTSASLYEGPFFLPFPSTLFLCLSQLLLFQTQIFSIGKHCTMLGKDPHTYIQLNIYDHELLLLTIISMVSKLGYASLNSYLPLCLIETTCSKNMLLSVNNH